MTTTTGTTLFVQRHQRVNPLFSHHEEGEGDNNNNNASTQPTVEVRNLDLLVCEQLPVPLVQILLRVWKRSSPLIKSTNSIHPESSSALDDRSAASLLVLVDPQVLTGGSV
jgi:hypothetical protein